MTPATILAFAVGLYLWVFIGTLVHEGAHLLAGRLAGFSPFAMRIGRGPVLFARRLGGVDVLIRAFPGFGLVSARPLLSGLPWRGALFSIAGPLSDTLLLLVALTLAGSAISGQGSLANMFFGMCALWQLLLTTLSLFPWDYRVEGFRMSSDGKLFLKYLTGRTSRDLRAYENAVARYDPQFRVEDSWLMQGHRSMLTVYSSANEDYAAGRYPEATEKYLSVLDEVQMHPAERALTLDRMACIPVTRGDHRFLAQAETWAREASALVPGCKTIRGTLGAILVERGRCAEGLALLTPLTTEDNDSVDRTLASCFVAKALDRMGKGKEADKWLETARSSGSFPEVCLRVESELSRDRRSPPCPPAAIS